MHSHALRQGRSPAANNRFTPLANHAEVLAANLTPVQIDPLGVHATTRSCNAVTFSDTATARSYAPDDRPRQVSTAPSTAVPLQGTTVSMPAGPVRPPAPQPSDVPGTSGASTSSAAAGDAATHAAQAQPAAPSMKTKSTRKGRKKSTITSSGSPPATSVEPHPTAGAEVHPAKLAATSGKSNRRPTLQADRGDVCDESDSDKLARRRSQLEQFRQQMVSKNVPQRVYRAILHSTVTLSLAELAALAMHDELVFLLVQIADTLRDDAEPGSLRGPRAAVDSFLTATLRRIVLADEHVPANDTGDMLVGAFQAAAAPSAQDAQWSEAMCASAEWQKVPGKMSTVHVPFSHMRICTAFLTSEVERPHKHSPQAVCVAFDEGAEMSTITIDAWERHRADCEQGCSLFAERNDIGPTHGIRMKDPVSLWSFHGAVSNFHHMVLVHFRLGCAMYPVYCTLVNGAPADVMLGLSFRRKFEASFPVGFHTSQGPGVTSVCLGVPEGHALFFPKPLRERFAD